MSDNLSNLKPYTVKRFDYPGYAIVSVFRDGTHVTNLSIPWNERETAISEALNEAYQAGIKKATEERHAVIERNLAIGDPNP